MNTLEASKRFYASLVSSSNSFPHTFIAPTPQNVQSKRYKDHLIAGLSSYDPNFSLHLWDRLIPHATLTLNLLHPYRINSRLSAEAQLNGAFDFNRTPLAPPGTRVMVHKTPNNRRTWAPHGVDGWYIGTSPDH